jgi:hypothetical protein
VESVITMARRTHSWGASVMIDRQQAEMGPGDGLFVVPGEVHWTPRVKQTGDLRALVIDDDVFHQLAEEQGLNEKPLCWKHGFARPSAALLTRLLLHFHELSRDENATLSCWTTSAWPDLPSGTFTAVSLTPSSGCVATDATVVTCFIRPERFHSCRWPYGF